MRMETFRTWSTEASQDGSTIDSENLAEIEKTINDFLYAYDGKNYYQVYSFKDNVNASLSEALSVNALNDISDYVASAENNNTFHKVINRCARNRNLLYGRIWKCYGW